MASLDIIRGRQAVATLTNKSGGAVVAGDLVIVDATTDESFTTTSSANAEVSIGIAQESIANNASGRVLLYGYAPLVTTALISQTRGNYLFHSSNTKTAKGNVTRSAGAVGQFLESGTAPSAWLWGITDPTATGAGLGAWTDYTPTWAATSVNPTLGNGTLVGRYKALDAKTLAISIALQMGTTTTAGTGEYSFSFPTYTSAARVQVISGYVLDSGTARFVAQGIIMASATTVGKIACADASGDRTVGAAIPIAWANGDQINLSGIFEVV